jgi:hypothetical protein
MRATVEIRHRAILHVVHEYANFVSSAQIVTTGRHQDKGLDSPIKRHVAHDFLLSCRKLRDFFTGSGDRDVIAGHYVTSADFHLPVSDKWKEAIDRQLAHISLDRVENSREILRPTQAALYAELRTAWKLFLVNLPTLYQIDFDRELSEKEKLIEFGGVDLR